MTELGPESRALIDEERALGEPTPAELESRRLAVFASLGLPLPAPTEPPAGGGAPAAEAASGGGGSAGLATTTKLALVVGVAALGTLGYLAMRAPDERPPQRRSVPTTSVAVAPAIDPAPEPLDAPTPPILEPEPLASRRAPRIQPTEEVAPPVVAIENHEPDPAPVDSLSEESMLVAAAEAQLRAGHASEALSLYDRALARHPTGSLRAEAISGRIASLCRLGRTEDGRRELERFLASYPRSPSAPRLRSACGVEP